MTLLEKLALFILTTTCFFLFNTLTPAATEKADLILTDAQVFTANKNNDIHTTVAIKNGTILAVGGNDIIAAYKNHKTNIISLPNHTIIPGLHDAHLHFESGADILINRLSLRFMSLKEIQNQIAAVVNASPKGALIKGYHYNHALFKDKKWPSRHDLDTVAPNNPVIIERVDGHSVWVNTKALEMAGLTKESKEIPGGEIMRDNDGFPTGILKENACRAVEKLEGPKMVIPGRDGKDSLTMGIAYANQLGLTTVTTSGTIALLEKLNKLKDQGKLTLRFNVWLPAEELETALNAGLRFHQGDDWVRVSLMKIFIDGTIGSATAAMFKPYVHRPESTGILIHPIEKFNAMVENAHKHDWPVGIHAIGNRGVHLSLNAVEAAQKKYGPKPHVRHRIEHSQFVTDADLKRYKQLGVIASMQPTHCTSDLLVVEDRIGTQRAKQGYRWKSFENDGNMIAFGTDWPIEPLDPRRGLYSAVERKNIETGEPKEGWFPEEQISILNAVKYYTLGAAHASTDENTTGSIEKGKKADLTIFKGDLLNTAQTNPKGLLTLPVHMTIVAGTIVYENRLK